MNTIIFNELSQQWTYYERINWYRRQDWNWKSAKEGYCKLNEEDDGLWIRPEEDYVGLTDGDIIYKIDEEYAEERIKDIYERMRSDLGDSAKSLMNYVLNYYLPKYMHEINFRIVVEIGKMWKDYSYFSFRIENFLIRDYTKDRLFLYYYGKKGITAYKKYCLNNAEIKGLNVLLKNTSSMPEDITRQHLLRLHKLQEENKSFINMWYAKSFQNFCKEYMNERIKKRMIEDREERRVKREKEIYFALYLLSICLKRKKFFVLF